MRAAALVLLAALAAGGAAAQEGCGEREVAPGETLGGIAGGLPGVDARALFEANRDRLSDPDLIRPGQRLRVPCPPDRPTPAPPETAAEAPAEAPADPAQPSAAPTPPPAAPLPAVAETPPRLHLAPVPPGLRAAEAATPRLLAALGEVERVASAAEADLLWPVAAPDCARLERLAPEDAAPCLAWDLSAPLARAPVVWIARAGSQAAAATAPGDLRGLTVCRPAGAPDADLAAAGLAPPRAARLAPATAADCLAAVAAGEAEVASLPGGAPATLPEGLARIPALASQITLHAAARRDAPAGRAALARLAEASGRGG